MEDIIREIFDIEAWNKRIQEEPSIVLTNFVPWSIDCLEWECSSSERAVWDGSQSISTVWDNPADINERVLINAHQFSSSAETLQCLQHLISTHQVYQMPEGPADLGRISLIYPKEESATIFLVRGNLCLSIVNFGKASLGMLDWAYRLDSRIMDKPEYERDLFELTPPADPLTIGEEIEIGYELPFGIGDEGSYKFFGTGVDLSLRENRLYAVANQQGEVTIEAFAVEAGREPFGSIIRMNVK